MNIIANKRIKQAEAIRAEAAKQKRDEAALIKQGAEKLFKSQYATKMNALEQEFDNKIQVLHTLTLSGIVYSILATLLTAIQSPRFSGDFLAFCGFIFQNLQSLWVSAVSLASWAWALNQAINVPIISIIVPGILAIAVFVLVFGGILCLIGFAIYKAALFYHKQLADLRSVLVSLISGALIVWFADSLDFIKLNLIAVWGILYGIYLFCRLILAKLKI